MAFLARTTTCRTASHSHAGPAVTVRRHCLAGCRAEVAASAGSRLVAPRTAPRTSFVHGYSLPETAPHSSHTERTEFSAPSPQAFSEADREAQEAEALIARLEAKLWDANADLEDAWGEMCDVWVGNALVDALVDLTPQEVDLDTCPELTWEQLEREMSGIHAMVDVTARISEKTYNKMEANLTSELEALMAELDELTAQPADDLRLYITTPAADTIPLDTLRTRRSTSSPSELYIN